MHRFNKSGPFIATLGVSILFCAKGFCANVVYVQTPSDMPYVQEQVQNAAALFGLTLDTVVIKEPADGAKVLSAMKGKGCLAVIISGRAIIDFDQHELFATLRNRAQHIPLLITGIDEQSDPKTLSEWSNAAIDGCEKASPGRNSSYEITKANAIAHQLVGVKLPLTGSDVRFLKFDSHGQAESLISVMDGSAHLAVLARTSVAGQEIFFATAPVVPGVVNAADNYREPAELATIASQVLFLHYAAGDRGWHSPGHYANFTIDDAWLREPYGYVQYDALLQEMKKHNFHTTIAFIPWNYDRSESSVVKLLHEDGDRYSICVHGDNHDHQEFGPYKKKPLGGQIEDMKQALARMEAFRKLTNLSYDPVMVFPHKISPEETLAYLKRFDYWATINGDNVPSDVEQPSDSGFELRPVTLMFANFPSIRRYSAEGPIPQEQLAIDAFLGNPMFFYSHEAYFATGAAAFDAIADSVNNLEPDTQWRSLGVIVQHLYLEKLRADGNWDVRLFSPVFELSNSENKAAVYFLQKDEDGTIPFKVTVDGIQQPYEFTKGLFEMHVSIPAKSHVLVAINYQNDLNLAAVDISKSSLRINAIRYLSDFRDEVVSKSAVGRWFIQSYLVYRTAWNIGTTGTVMLVALLIWRLRAGRKKLRSTPGAATPLRHSHKPLQGHSRH